MQAIVVSQAGGPEVLVPTEIPEPSPRAGELLVDVDHAGVNFIDTYKRSGRYAVELPFIPGEEGSGVVATVGDGAGFAAGDRVAWANVPASYGDRLVVPAERAVAVPDDVALDVAAAVMLQGMTAHYLVQDTYPLQPGDRCLIHAGAGGAGRLLVQLAKQRGAEVFTTAAGVAKADVARSAGADHVIDYEREDFRAAVERIAGPRPLDVVYDGVGATTFEDGLGLLRPRGTMVLFGAASGAVPPVDPLRLMAEGSLYLTRPSLGHYIATRGDLEWRAGEVLGAVAAGALDVLIGSVYSLEQAAEAHRALEGRRTVGKVLIRTV